MIVYLKCASIFRGSRCVFHQRMSKGLILFDGSLQEITTCDFEDKCSKKSKQVRSSDNGDFARKKQRL